MNHTHAHTPNGEPEVVVRATAAVSAPDTAPTGTDTAIDPSRATAQLCTALQRFGRRALQQLRRPVEVSVLLCDAATIRALNARYRGRDEVTDVLSFPMREGMAVPDTPSAAAQGDATGRDGLSFAMREGMAVPDTPSAAAQGDAAGRDGLSFPMREGMAVPDTPSAAAQGDATGRDGLSFAMREGMAVPDTPSAAAQGDAAGRDGLSFPMREGMAMPDTPPAAARGDAVVGDVVIAVEVAARQAANRAEPLERELCRLLVHGMLHLLGMDHADPPDDDDRMITLQERILTELHPGTEAALAEAAQLMR